MSKVCKLQKQYHRLNGIARQRLLNKEISGETFYRYLYLIRKAYEKETGTAIKRFSTIEL